MCVLWQSSRFEQFVLWSFSLCLNLVTVRRSNSTLMTLLFPHMNKQQSQLLWSLKKNRQHKETERGWWYESVLCGYQDRTRCWQPITLHFLQLCGFVLFSLHTVSCGFSPEEHDSSKHRLRFNNHSRKHLFSWQTNSSTTLLFCSENRILLIETQNTSWKWWTHIS